MTTLHVLDGTAMLFRYYYGHMQMTAVDGTEVGGVMGACQAIARFFRDELPTHVVAVFDAGPQTFRSALDPSYKANRGAPPDDLVPQFDLLPTALTQLGLPVFMTPGYEADDLMATLARWGLAQGLEVEIHAVDKDLLQLVRPGVTVRDPRKRVRYDAAAVEDRLGVRPDQVVDYMALVGDSVDNIPGVQGVGPKSAAAVLQALGDLEGIYANLERVLYLKVRGAKGLQTKLAHGREAAHHSRELVRLRDDVPEPAIDALTGPGSVQWRGPRDGADGFFRQLGFRGPLRTMHALWNG